MASIFGRIKHLIFVVLLSVSAQDNIFANIPNKDCDKLFENKTSKALHSQQTSLGHERVDETKIYHYIPISFTKKQLKNKFIAEKLKKTLKFLPNLKTKDRWTIYGSLFGLVFTHLSSAIITHLQIISSDIELYEFTTLVLDHLITHVLVDEFDDEIIVSAISGWLGRIYGSKVLNLEVAKSILKNAKAAPFALDLNDNFQVSSVEFEKIFKLPSIQKDLKSSFRNIRDVFPHDLVKFFYNLKSNALISEGTVSQDLHLSINGHSYLYEVEMTPIINESGELISVAGFVRNLQRVVDVEKNWYEKSKYDVMLSKLYNRGYIEMIIERSIETFNLDNKMFSVIFIDIDKFKDINDTYGHEIGDQVLHSIEDILSNFFRDRDHIGRWGGEELVAILEDSTLENGIRVAQRLRLEIEKAVLNIKTENNESKNINVSVTIGVSAFSEGDDLKSVVARADKGLYKGKKNGRNQVVGISQDGSISN
ncbi:MAG: GGDEF domain-containing protein [Halobacteriovoraceae bacterium]|nr:GGDEF domain-containing protein [Halobacteriovoraceae bacterium]